MKTMLFLLLALNSLTAFCQKGDYLVKQNGDTLYGNIELKNKEFIVSRSSAKPVIFNAVDIKNVHSENFKGTVVLPCLLHIYADDLEVLLKYQYYTGDRDTVLVLTEVYNTPKMNLYWGTDESKMQYYFYKTPSDPLPVQLYINYALGGGASASFEKKDVRGEDSKIHLEIQRSYINQLKLVMKDCHKISETYWELLDYRSYSFKNLIKKYNNCK